MSASRRELLLGLLALPALARAQSPLNGFEVVPLEPRRYKPEVPLPWTVLAASHHVLHGTLEVPVDELRRRLDEDDHAYIDLEIKAPEALYGDLASRPPKLRYYTRPLPSAPHPERVLGLHGQPVVACAALLDQPYNKGLYLAGYDPAALRASSEPLLATTRAELADQAALLDRYLRRQPTELEPEEAVVRELVERLGLRDEALVAWNDLYAIGLRAAPAVVRQMDDRRPVGAEALPLHKRQQDAGQAAHFGPELVVDALSGMLNELVGVAFGAIMNGASEPERIAEVRAWRIWRMKQPDAPA
ncbi:MAG: hypothetical protein H6741_30620 [Alphaproteobacteria bacterium]|nr:hypothetical protein [Alphaproteobacteria bacterium]